MKILFLLLALLGTAACGGADTPGGGGEEPTIVLSPNAPLLSTGAPGQPVKAPPSVVVRDTNGVILSGVPVTFTLTSGGGSVAGTDTVSNDSGTASLADWTLGAEAGTNTVVASTLGALPLTFRALGMGSSCDTLPLPFATTVTGTLSSSDCTFPDTSYVDYYLADLPAADAYYVREASADIDAYVVVLDTTGRPVAFNDDSLFPITTNSALTLLVPAGRYLVAANSFAARDVGTYTLRVNATTAQEDHCDRVFTLPGLATDQSVLTTDCFLASDSLYGDLFWLFLDAGQQVTITEHSASFDAQVGLYSATTLSLIDSNDNASDSTTDAQLLFTAPQAGYYVVFATTALKLTAGDYHLSIQPTGAGPSAGAAVRRGRSASAKPGRFKSGSIPLPSLRPKR